MSLTLRLQLLQWQSCCADMASSSSMTANTACHVIHYCLHRILVVSPLGGMFDGSGVEDVARAGEHIAACDSLRH